MILSSNEVDAAIKFVETLNPGEFFTHLELIQRIGDRAHSRPLCNVALVFCGISGSIPVQNVLCALANAVDGDVWLYADGNRIPFNWLRDSVTRRLVEKRKEVPS